MNFEAIVASRSFVLKRLSGYNKRRVFVSMVLVVGRVVLQEGEEKLSDGIFPR